jgi:hypothetical protein
VAFAISVQFKKAGISLLLVFAAAVVIFVLSSCHKIING